MFITADRCAAIVDEVVYNGKQIRKYWELLYGETKEL